MQRKRNVLDAILLAIDGRVIRAGYLRHIPIET
jgi:hypothetical protein